MKFSKWFENEIQDDFVPKNKPSQDIEISIPSNRNPSFSEEFNYSTEGGTLRIVNPNSKWWTYSVVETYVDESQRRQGVASKLIDKALEHLKGKGSIAAQTSSDGSTMLYWNKGFRNESNNLEKALQDRRENSSVLLVHPNS